MIQMLAQTGEFSGLTIGVGAITALGIAVAAVVKAFRAGEKRGELKNEVTLKKPVPTIRVREEAQWATQPDFQGFIERSDKQFGEIWDAIQQERGIARTALSRIHDRIDQQALATAKVQGTLDEVKGTLGRLLDLALHRTNSTKRV